MSEETVRDELTEIMIYLLTSARVCIEEPKRYGSFRLFQAYRKLLQLALRHDLVRDTRMIRDAVDEIERNEKLISSSSCVESDEYSRLLDRLIVIMVGGL